MQTNTNKNNTNKYNPVNSLENFFEDNELPFFRDNQNEIGIEITGKWCHKQIYFIWQEIQQTLYFTCRMDIQINETQRTKLDSVLVGINSQLWMGHFELCPDSGAPTFRHTLPLRNMPEVSSEVIEDIISAAERECERFYPAFQLVLWGGYNSKLALQSCLLECQGEA